MAKVFCFRPFCISDESCERYTGLSVCVDYRCVPPHAGEGASPFSTFFALLVSFVVSGLALSAGIGGGGLYVPLLILSVSMEPKAATAVSQAMLAGGASAALFKNLQAAHPADPTKPLIDFDLALLLAPSLMAGASVGSFLHSASPSWLILVLLLIVLGDASQKSVRKAIELRKKEQEEAAKVVALRTDVPLLVVQPSTIGCSAGSSTSSEASGLPAKEKPPTVPASDEAAEVRQIRNQIAAEIAQEEVHWTSRLPAKKAGALFLLFVVQCGSTALKGGRGFKSILHVHFCGAGYFLITIVALAVEVSVAVFQASLSADVVVQEREAKVAGESSWRLLRWSLIAGVVASMCGVGGGMVMGPILLEIGVQPEVSSATTATTLLLLSSSTALMLLSQGTAPIHTAALFACSTFAGSYTGKTLVDRTVKRLGQPSLIVCILAGILVVSSVVLSMLGLQNVVEALRTHEGLWFSSPCSEHDSDACELI